MTNIELDLSKYKQLKINDIEKVKSKMETFYDLTVEDDHTFHIVSDGRNVLFKNCDGSHIMGLLVGFILKYLPEYKDKISFLKTPIFTVTKNKKLISWHYTLGEDVKLKAGEVVSYKKGLGSWKEAELKEIIEIEGLSTVISDIEIDSEQIVDDWLGDDSDIRKEYIQANTFSIAKL